MTCIGEISKYRNNTKILKILRSNAPVEDILILYPHGNNLLIYQEKLEVLKL